MSSNWYFAKSGTSNGPVNLDDLRRDLQTGVLGPDTLVWNATMPNWQAASTVAELRVAPPPLPPGQRAGAADIAPVSLIEPRRAPAPWSPHPTRDTNPPPTQNQSQIGPDGLYIGAPARGFGEAISTCFSKYVTFSGRASRSEYWFFWLFCCVIGLIPVVGLLTILPSMAVTFRRLHDTDRSGWWAFGVPLGLGAFGIAVGALSDGGRTPEAMLAPFGAIIGLGFFAWMIAMLVFMCLRGTPGPNRFG